jgi:hypothetical protein
VKKLKDHTSVRRWRGDQTLYGSNLVKSPPDILPTYLQDHIRDLRKQVGFVHGVCSIVRPCYDQGDLARLRARLNQKSPLLEQMDSLLERQVFETHRDSLKTSLIYDSSFRHVKSRCAAPVYALHIHAHVQSACFLGGPDGRNGIQLTPNDRSYSLACPDGHNSPNVQAIPAPLTRERCSKVQQAGDEEERLVQIGHRQAVSHAVKLQEHGGKSSLLERL